MLRREIAEMIAGRLVELVENKSIKVSEIAKAAGIHPTTALCYVQGEALPKADKFSALIALIDSQKS